MVMIPNIPIPPLANSSQLIEPRILATPDRAATAAERMTICPANFVIDLLSVFISLAAATKTPTKTDIPTRPFLTPSQSRLPMIFIAPAKIRTAAPKPIIDIVLAIFPKLPTMLCNGFREVSFSLPINAIAPINSPNITAIDPRD